VRSDDRELPSVIGVSGRVAVAAIGHTIMPVQQFTTDKSLIAGAFQQVQHMPVNASYHEIDRSILSDRTRNTSISPPTTTTANHPFQFTRADLSESADVEIYGPRRGRPGAVVLRRRGKKFMILVTAVWRTTHRLPPTTSRRTGNWSNSSWTWSRSSTPWCGGQRGKLHHSRGECEARGCSAATRCRERESASACRTSTQRLADQIQSIRPTSIRSALGRSRTGGMYLPRRI